VSNTSIEQQRQNSIASFQLWQAAKAQAAAKKSAHSAHVETPALTTVEIAQREEHESEAAASVDALRRYDVAKAEANEE
jgi:hypothetical protein